VTEQPDIVEFMSVFRPDSHATKTLALGYYLELFNGAQSFGVADIRQAYRAAKLSPSSNISVEIYLNIQRGRMFRPQSGRYALTQDGLEQIRGRLAVNEADEMLDNISESLRSDMLGIADADQRDYLEEALKCLGVGAYRGAVLMGWEACMDNLYVKIEQAGLGAFHQACTQFIKKPRAVKTKNDLEYYKDSELLKAAERLGLFDRNVRAALERQLGLRNRCGHPGDVKPRIHTVNAFFEEIIQYVLGVN
jgi:hypothetical protein